MKTERSEQPRVGRQAGDDAQGKERKASALKQKPAVPEADPKENTNEPQEQSEPGPNHTQKRRKTDKTDDMGAGDEGQIVRSTRRKNLRLWSRKPDKAMTARNINKRRADCRLKILRGTRDTRKKTQESAATRTTDFEAVTKRIKSSHKATEKQSRAQRKREKQGKTRMTGKRRMRKHDMTKEPNSAEPERETQTRGQRTTP